MSLTDPDLVVARFAWPRGEFARAAQGQIAIGWRDRPERQDQLPEIVRPEDLSLLVVGSAGSGRTSVLRSLTAQVTKQGVAAVIIVDPTSSDPAPWRELVVGDALHTLSRSALAEFGLLLTQLERALDQPDCADRVLVVIDRIDVVVAGTDPLFHDRLAYLITDGPRRGIMVVASSDVRFRLPPSINRAFRAAWIFSEEHPFVLLNDAADVMRPFHLAEIEPTSVSGSAVVIGRISDEAAAARLAGHRDSIAIGVDEQSHEVVGISGERHLMVAYGEPSTRSDLLKIIGEAEYRLYQNRILVLAPEPFTVPDWGVDVLAEMEAKPSGDTAYERCSATIQSHLDHGSSDLVLLVEYHEILRELRSRFKESKARFDPIKVLSQFVEMSGIRLVASNRRIYDLNRYSFAKPDTADHVWFQPPRMAVAENTGMTADFLKTIAAFSGKTYGPRQGTASIEGERHELFFPRTANRETAAHPTEATVEADL